MIKQKKRRLFASFPPFSYVQHYGSVKHSVTVFKFSYAIVFGGNVLDRLCADPFAFAF